MSASKCCGTAPNQHEYHQPTSLLTLTTEFVACHLIYVESLATVPDIVGESIFQAALRMNQFESESPALRLKPFTLAYKLFVLETLQINAGYILDRHLPEVKLFKHLRQLDLTGCDIDDYHEVIVHVGTELHLLEVLLLADNNLSDVGIQRLTAYSRVMVKAGLNNLTYLDLSGNQNITNRIFAYLKPFHRLVTLKLTGCTINTTGKESLFSKMGFVACMSDPRNVSAEVISKGWAAPLIDRWMNQRPVIQFSSSAAKFYSKKQTTPLCTKREPDNQTALVLVRQSGHPWFTSDVVPSSRLKVGASKYPSRKENDRGDISQMSESKKTVGRTVNNLSLEGRHKRCHSSVSSESLLATYTKDAIEIQNMEITHLDNVESECKLVKNRKRKSNHPAKSKRRKIKLVHTKLDPSEADPGDVVSHKKCSAKETGRKDVKSPWRKPSIFEYLD